ncbi:MAG: hypothetical protein ACKO3T_20735 [Planctomycetaceae bacterium]
MARESSKTARAIVEEVLTRGFTNRIWSANCPEVFPVTFSSFDLTAVLPAVFYMCRFAIRRGRGQFLTVFGGEGTKKEKKTAATIQRVSEILASGPLFSGFETETEKSILGDLLLSFCLENKSHALGRDQPLTRVAPAHYLSAWVDLPEKVSDLRLVPEMLVALLAGQNGEYIQQTSQEDSGDFAVGRGLSANLLLQMFAEGVVQRPGKTVLNDLAADMVDEQANLGIDQLLMIRISEALQKAPDKIRGKEEERISTQLPISQRVSQWFGADLRDFTAGFGRVIPRQTFIATLEACMSLGLFSMFTSTAEMLFAWFEHGTLPSFDKQSPAPFFVDASSGVSRELRDASEISMGDFFRRLESLPVVLMCIRLLDFESQSDEQLKQHRKAIRPYANTWIDLLGEILHKRHPESRDLHRTLSRLANQLAPSLEAEHETAAELLMSSEVQDNVVIRLSNCLVYLQGRSNTFRNMLEWIDCALMAKTPAALTRKRSVSGVTGGMGTARRDVRSFVMTDDFLDYIVHLHVARSRSDGVQRPLSFQQLLQTMRDRYGLYVDQGPPGTVISDEILRLNRSVLERRLRDLGLLVGVNDAESMKHLRPRYAVGAAS